MMIQIEDSQIEFHIRHADDFYGNFSKGTVKLSYAFSWEIWM